jgi:hypothetical protein
LSKQCTHLALGPCWQSILACPSLSLRSTGAQFKHFPPGPWLHLPLSSTGFSAGFSAPTAIQFRHFPPGGWLHFAVIFPFLNHRKNTADLMSWFLYAWLIFWVSWKPPARLHHQQSKEHLQF